MPKKLKEKGVRKLFFTEDKYDRGFEQVMKAVPNFYPRGSGIIVTGKFKYTAEICDCRYCAHFSPKKGCMVDDCVCLEERVAVGVASVKEIMKATMSEIKHNGFNRRLRRYIKESEAIPMTFISENHRANFNTALGRVSRYERGNYALMSALYLLTAEHWLWQQSKRFVDNRGISFGKLRPHNCSPHTYSLYCAAKDLYLGTKHITISDLADSKLIGSKTFQLICNAMAIRKFGLPAVGILDEEWR